MVKTYHSYLNDYNKRQNQFMKRFENPYMDTFKVNRPTPNMVPYSSFKPEVSEEPTKRSVLGRVFDTLLAPNYAVAGFVDGFVDGKGGRTPLQGAWEGIKAGNPFGKGFEEGRTTFSDVLETGGWKPESLMGKIGKGATGFVLDVVFDPTTYLTGGLSAVVKGTGRAGRGVIGVKKVLGEGDRAVAFNKAFDEALSKGATREQALSDARKAMDSILHPSATGTHVTDESAQAIIGMQNRISGKNMSPEELATNSKNLADRYNKLFGIYDAREAGRVTFGIGNLPFAPKSIRDKVWDLGSSGGIARFADATKLSWAYGFARDMTYGSKLGRLFSNNARLYDLSKRDPVSLWNKMEHAIMVSGQGLDKVQAERAILKVFEDLDLTPSENKEILELLQDNKIQHTVKSMIKDKRNAEVKEAIKMFQEKRNKANAELEELLAHNREYKKMKESEVIDKERFQKRLEEMKLDFKKELESVELLRYANDDVAKKYIEDTMREYEATKMTIPDGMTDEQALAELYREVLDQESARRIAMSDASRRAEKLSSSAREGGARVDSASVEKGVSEEILKGMDSASSSSAVERFTQAMSAHIYGRTDELRSLSLHSMESLMNLVRRGRSRREIKEYIESRPSLFNPRARDVNSILAEEFNYKSWSKDGMGHELGRLLGYDNKKAEEVGIFNMFGEAFKRVKRINSSAENRRRFLKEGQDALSMYGANREVGFSEAVKVLESHGFKIKDKNNASEVIIKLRRAIYNTRKDFEFVEEVSRLSATDKARRELRDKLLEMPHHELKVYMRERANKIMWEGLKDIEGVVYKPGYGAFMDDYTNRTVRNNRGPVETEWILEDVPDSLKELNVKKGMTVDLNFINKHNISPDSLSRKTSGSGSGGGDRFELYEYREPVSRNPYGGESYHDPFAEGGKYYSEPVTYSGSMQLLHEKGMIDLRNMNMNNAITKRGYGEFIREMSTVSGELYNKPFRMLSDAELAIVAKRSAERINKNIPAEIRQAHFTESIREKAEAIIKRESKLAEGRSLNSLKNVTALDVYRMPIDEYETSRLKIVEEGIQEHLKELASEGTSAMKKKREEVVKRWEKIINSQKEAIENLNKKYSDYFESTTLHDPSDIDSLVNDIAELERKINDRDAIETYLELRGRAEINPESMIENLIMSKSSSDKVGEIAIKLRKSFIEAGEKEVKAGLMSREQLEANFANYLPRILTDDGKDFFKMIKEDAPGSTTRVSNDIGFGESFNPHSMSRSTEGSVEDVNRYFQEKYSELLKGKNVFSEDVADIYLARMLKHNEIMFDDNYAKTMINDFGKDIIDGAVEDGYKAVINYGDLRKSTRDLASMRTSLRITNDIRGFLESNGRKLASEAHELGIEPQKHIDKAVSDYIAKNWPEEKIQSYWDKSHSGLLRYTGIPGKSLDEQAVPMVELSVEQMNKFHNAWDSVYDKLKSSLENSRVSAGRREDPVRLRELEVMMEKMRHRTRPVIKQVSDVIVEDANRARKLAIAKNENRFLQVYDKFLHFMKMQQTVVVPAFHTRNKLSNIYNNWLVTGTDAFNMQWHRAATHLSRIEGDPRKLKKLIDENPQLESVFQNIELGEHVHDSLKQVVDVSNGLRWVDAYDLAYHYGVIDRGIFARDVGVSSGSDGILKGLKIGNVSLDPTDTKNFALYKLGTRVGTTVENSDRVIGFVSALRQGHSVQEAAELSKKALFDYSDLTYFEHNVMKRILPYYAWLRKNSRLQVGALLEEPGKIQTVAKLLSGIEGMNNKEDRIEDAFLSEWARDWTQLPFKIAGKPVIMSGNLPYMDFSRLPDPHDISGSARDIFSQMSPAITNPVELGLNYNAFFNDKIAKNPEDIPKKYAEHIASQFGLYNVAKGFNKNTVSEALVHGANSITGLKMSPYHYFPGRGQSRDEPGPNSSEQMKRQRAILEFIKRLEERDK